MGDVISLSERRHARVDAPHRPQSRAARAIFYFDLSLPGTYLAAERVDRAFPGVRWEPALFAPPADLEALVVRTERRATELNAPLVWPDRFLVNARPVMRVASLACERGRGALFALAAGRLAFCGGFDLADPEVIFEAAAAAGLPLEDVLRAAGETARDAGLDETTNRLLAAGVAELPAIALGTRVFAGEEQLGAALAAAHASEPPRFHRPAAS